MEAGRRDNEGGMEAGRKRGEEMEGGGRGRRRQGGETLKRREGGVGLAAMLL